MHGTHVITNKSANKNVVFLLALDLKIKYNKNYESMIPMPWTTEEKYFVSFI